MKNDNEDTCDKKVESDIDEKNSRMFEYLLEAYDELRDELKMRIQQRDNLAIQFIVIVGVLAGIAFTDYDYSYFSILLIPLMTLFFAIQIFSSYEVHDRLVRFIREHVEAGLGKELKVDEDKLCDFFWEQYCRADREIHNVKMPGSRKGFFQKLLIVVPIVCSVCFYLLCFADENEIIPLKWNLCIAIGAAILYLLWGAYYLYRFNVKPKIVVNKNLSACDYKRRTTKIKSKEKAIFLDRDGTLHVDKVETTLEKGLEIFSDVAETLKEFQKKGYRLIVVTNQSGIAKGHITLKQMKKFNRALRKKLKENGCKLDAIYYCPHKKDDYCRCAKPETGMFERAINEFNIDIEASYVIGDKIGDIEAAKKIGILQEHWLFVKTGIYENNDYNTEPNIKKLNPKICNNMKETLKYVD